MSRKLLIRELKNRLDRFANVHIPNNNRAGFRQVVLDNLENVFPFLPIRGAANGIVFHVVVGLR